MRISHILRHRCDIQARTNTRDELGQKSGGFAQNPDGTPRFKGENVACRAYVKEAFEKISDKSFGITQDMYTIYFERGADIGESDRISEVRDPGGLVIGQNLDVTSVRNIPGGKGNLHHIEVTAFAYRDGVSINWDSA